LGGTDGLDVRPCPAYLVDEFGAHLDTEKERQVCPRPGACGPFGRLCIPKYLFTGSAMASAEW
jgi:hypothetical protein